MCMHDAPEANTFREYTVYKRSKFKVMNKLTLLLVAFFFMSSVVFATSVTQTADLTQKTVAPVINVKIDLGDITKLNQNDIAGLIDKNLLVSIPDLPALQCAITIEATFSIGIMSFSVSVTVSGDCSEVRSSGRALAIQIINEVKNYLDQYF
jgi:hypothetical protein